jgi:endonuclease/exonuclease/phosphatase family metal-dependent hydrolase
MLTFLFWNIQRKPLTASLKRLIHLHQVDVLMLAECPLRPADLLPELNSTKRSEYHYSAGNLCEKIEMYTRFADSYVMALPERPRAAVRHFVLPDRPSLLLVAVHLIDKRNHSEAGQHIEASWVSSTIQESEKLVGHHRTMVVGDFNMNPFEQGIIATDGFHAVMTREIASKREREVQNNLYPFFYNPMWNHFGDANGLPSGTYYHWAAEHICYFWNMLDQVLVRPDLLSVFKTEEVQILTNDGADSLIKANGRPDEAIGSDHLPILFKLHI